MKMSDDQLRVLLHQEVSQAAAWSDSNIREEQERNLRYYLGLPMGNEVAGRSQVLSWDVFEIVESAMPSFIEPFFGGDRIGEFQPRTQDDEAYCEQATDYVNYLIKDANPGFMIFTTWLKDALISKVGVVRAEWRDEPPKKGEYVGLSDEQLIQIAQDPAIEITEHKAYPVPGMPPLNEAEQIMLGGQVQIPMLHDITMRKKQPGCVRVENVRPENFIISRGAKSTEAARIVGEFVTYTRSDLAEMGHPTDVASFDAHQFDGQIEVLRDDTSGIVRENDGSADPAMEEVTLFRGFVRCDYDGDGIAELRRVLAAGDQVLENEEAEWQDYCIITPIPIPHRVIGMGYADPASEIQDIKTALTRQYLDSLYRANNPRTYVNMQASVNLDDLLTTRIGGVVRGNGPAANAIQPLMEVAVSRDALEGIQYADNMRETRLGITRYNQGLDSDSLNKTATGVQKIMNAADKRQQMTLRIMAETGIRDLFRLTLRLITKYQDMASTVRLRNQWVQFNPQGWNPDMDCVVAVGVGNGDKTETLMMLQQFGQFMAQAVPFGVVKPENVYEFLRLVAKNGKLRGAEEKLITDPSKNPQPPQPSPDQIKAQADVQKFQAEKNHETTEADKDRAHEERMKAAELASREREKLLELAAAFLAGGQGGPNMTNGSTLDQSAQAPGFSMQDVQVAAQAINSLANELQNPNPTL
ncbi:hypothetical protein WG922_21555 [Ramlibacter sp. AN1015]|uniref:portal protein n=1 Tax=Ramlibacter sp. AN1015 TaxID=3133428 RepID=UPI0030BF4D3D